MADEERVTAEPDQSVHTSGSPIGSISILVVDDDTTCLSIVAAILKSWKYEVVAVKHPMEALCTLRVRGGSFDLVVTDVHMPDMNGFELQKKIAEEFNLPVVFMSADNQESNILKGLRSGAAFFLVKPISPNDLKNLWQYAVAKNSRKPIIMEEIKTTQETSLDDKKYIHELDHSPIQETSDYEKSDNEELESEVSLRNEDQKSPKDSKRKSLEDVEMENEDDSSTMKKMKVVWTNALHNQFLEAIRCVGLERAVPKKILELMNVPGLTRENIASHLQKYRIFLKRVSDASNKIQSARERNMVERTFRSNFAMAQPFLMHKKPQWQSLHNLDQIGKSLQLNSSYSDQELASSTNFPPLFGTGQSRLPLNQSYLQQPLFGGTKPFYHQANSTPFSLEPTDYQASLLPNGNANISRRIMDRTTFTQTYQQKNVVAPESCTKDHIAGYENVGDFYSSELISEPNYKNKSYVGYRLASDGRLVGLSTDLYPNPNRGLINVVQSESTSNLPIFSCNPRDYFSQEVSSMGFQSSPTFNDAIQNENISVTPISPATFQTNEFGNEEQNDIIFGLMDDNVSNNACGIDSNPTFLQPYGEGSFDIQNYINNIQAPTQLGDVEDLCSVFSFNPDHVEINTTMNKETLEQLSGNEMIFSNFDIDGVEEYFSPFDQTFDLLDDQEFLQSVFGTNECGGGSG